MLAGTMSIEGKAPELAGRVLWYLDDAGRRWVGGWGSEGDARLRPAGDEELRVLAACDGARGSPALAREAGVTIGEAERILDDWSASIPGSFAWRPSGGPDKRARQDAIALDMLLEARAVDRLASIPDNRAYHASRIADAERHFDDVENTVSHAYGGAHPALRGRSYGEAFFDACASLRALRPGARVLEIGCGTGRFARAFLDAMAAHLPDAYRTATYTMFDLAPALTASQRRLTSPHADRTAFENGDIETHSFGSRRFDLVIANEMMADLSVEIADRDRPGAVACVERYALSGEGALRRFVVNSGAIRLLERIAGILEPGGCAVATEYGSRDAFPVAVELGDHTEHSIHFGHLEQVARRLGLDPRCESLLSWLGFDASCEVIANDSLMLLRRLSRQIFGRPLPAAAYTREQLRDAVGGALDRVENVRFRRVGDRRSHMCPGEFQALRMRRGAAATRASSARAPASVG
ncbi:MAG TPA: class I SAM-dependent methyltransferase [Polyangiaceae bacterium]|nr:class I SAM-dependent methyltransferase [Polyangiaceae bacterium]